MKEYRKIANFHYKDNNYLMLLDNNNKHFFLRTDDDGHFSYISLMEYIELSDLFIDMPRLMNIEKNKQKKMKIVPKVIIGTSLATITLPIVLAGVAVHQHNKEFQEYKEKYQNSTMIESTTEDNIEKYSNYVSIEDNEEKEKLEADTFYESKIKGDLYIYDSEFGSKYFDTDNVSMDEVKDAIKNNDKITDKFKVLLNNYCDSVEEKYPDIDLRIFYENMKSLEIVECTDRELLEASWNLSSCGCYKSGENKIYVPKDYEYEKGTWDYQVITHEFSHALRTLERQESDRKVKCTFSGINYNNVLVEESLDTLFAVSLLDYEEKDLGYQLQSNYHSIILDSIDNYNLSDYVNHSCSYYAIKLDEFTGDENKATTMFELIQLQYNEYHDSNLSVDQSEYYPLYDYISDIYYKNRINSNMSYSEASVIKEELEERVMYDVPERYNIDINHFDEHFNEYCKDLGIKVKTK